MFLMLAPGYFLRFSGCPNNSRTECNLRNWNFYKANRNLLLRAPHQSPDTLPHPASCHFCLPPLEQVLLVERKALVTRSMLVAVREWTSAIDDVQKIGDVKVTSLKNFAVCWRKVYVIQQSTHESYIMFRSSLCVVMVNCNTLDAVAKYN